MCNNCDISERSTEIPVETTSDVGSMDITIVCFNAVKQKGYADGMFTPLLKFLLPFSGSKYKSIERALKVKPVQTLTTQELVTYGCRPF